MSEHEVITKIYGNMLQNSELLLKISERIVILEHKLFQLDKDVKFLNDIVAKLEERV